MPWGHRSPNWQPGGSPGSTLNSRRRRRRTARSTRRAARRSAIRSTRRSASGGGVSDLEPRRQVDRLRLGRVPEPGAAERCGTQDGRLYKGAADLYEVPYGDKAGGVATPVAGASTAENEEYYPALSPDDQLLAFTRVPVGQEMYANTSAEMYVVPHRRVRRRTRLTANDPPVCSGKSSPASTTTGPSGRPTRPTYGNNDLLLADLLVEPLRVAAGDDVANGQTRPSRSRSSTSRRSSSNEATVDHDVPGHLSVEPAAEPAEHDAGLGQLPHSDRRRLIDRLSGSHPGADRASTHRGRRAMAYRIKRKERVGKGIRRILREQLRRAIEAARDATASGRARARRSHPAQTLARRAGADRRPRRQAEEPRRPNAGCATGDGGWRGRATWSSRRTRFGFSGRGCRASCRRACSERMRDVSEQLRRNWTTGRSRRSCAGLRGRCAAAPPAAQAARQARPARDRQGHHANVPRGPARARGRPRRPDARAVPRLAQAGEAAVERAEDRRPRGARAGDALPGQGREAGRDARAGARSRLRRRDGRAPPALVRIGRRLRGGARAGRRAPGRARARSVRAGGGGVRGACARRARAGRERLEDLAQARERRPTRSRTNRRRDVARARRCRRGDGGARSGAPASAGARRNERGARRSSTSSYRDGHTRPRALAFNPDDGLLYAALSTSDEVASRRSGRGAAAGDGARARCAASPTRSLRCRAAACGRLPIRRGPAARPPRARAAPGASRRSRPGREAGRAGSRVAPGGALAYVASPAVGGVEVVSLRGAAAWCRRSPPGCRRARCASCPPARCRGRRAAAAGQQLHRSHRTVHADRRRRAAGRRARRRSAPRRRCWTCVVAGRAGVAAAVHARGPAARRAHLSVEGLDSGVIVLRGRHAAPPGRGVFDDPGPGKRAFVNLGERAAPVIELAAAASADAATFAVVGAGSDNLLVATRRRVAGRGGRRGGRESVGGRRAARRPLRHRRSAERHAQLRRRGRSTATLDVGAPERPTPAERGELLFYSRALVPNNVADGPLSLYTCAACHDDGHVDGRRHPAKRNRFFSMTEELSRPGHHRALSDARRARDHRGVRRQHRHHARAGRGARRRGLRQVPGHAARARRARLGERDALAGGAARRAGRVHGADPARAVAVRAPGRRALERDERAGLALFRTAAPAATSWSAIRRAAIACRRASWSGACSPGEVALTEPAPARGRDAGPGRGRQQPAVAARRVGRGALLQ